METEGQQVSEPASQQVNELAELWELAGVSGVRPHAPFAVSDIRPV
jgi:hypothetical protein